MTFNPFHALFAARRKWRGLAAIALGPLLFAMPEAANAYVIIKESKYTEGPAWFKWTLLVEKSGTTTYDNTTPEGAGSANPGVIWNPTVSFGEADFQFKSIHALDADFGDVSPSNEFRSTPKYIFDLAPSNVATLIFAFGQTQQTANPVIHKHDPRPDHYDNYNLSYFTPNPNQVSFTFKGVHGVPEPSSWAMMLLGLGALGASFRGRRRQAAALRTGRA